MSVESPCRKLCALDPATRVCAGCLRTLDEIARWSRMSDTFSSARHISHSHLRRRKAETLAAQPLARGVAQGDVWNEVQEKQERMGVRSRTSASRDTFEGILNGATNPTMAYMTGKLKVDGSLPAAMKLGAALG